MFVGPSESDRIFFWKKKIFLSSGNIGKLILHVDDEYKYVHTKF